MPSHCKIVFFVLIVLLASPVLAQNTSAASVPDYGGQKRLCQSEDLVGHVFALIEFKETPPRKENMWEKRFRYNYLHFVTDSKYEAMTFNKRPKSPAAVEKIMKNYPDYYALGKDGVLNLMHEDRVIYSYRCLAILQPTGNLIKGDLVFNGYTRKGRSELYKVYRIWY